MENKKSIVVKKKEKAGLVFAGSSHLLGEDPKKMNQLEIVAHKARVLVSQALSIPLNTVILMGNQPYVDNKGRKWKLNEYASAAQFEYDYVQIAKDDTEKAIVKCRLISGQGKALCGWVIGECSPLTTKMSTLKGYQNHMAQTRAENRAFEAAFGNRFRSDLYTGVAKIMQGGEVHEEVAEKALASGNTSAEEAVPMKQEKSEIGKYERAKIAIQAMKTKAELKDAQVKVSAYSGYTKGEKVQLLALIEASLNDAK